MSDLKIPDDLKNTYLELINNWKTYSTGPGPMKILIERIAALTAERDAAQEQLVMAHEEMATVNALIIERDQFKQVVHELGDSRVALIRERDQLLVQVERLNAPKEPKP
jgi:serine/threonine protein phosphatase PrpC